MLPGCVLVRIAASLVSAGTERASSEFASKNLLQKAKARPDLVREVIGKVRRDGLLSAMQAVRSRLDQPSALGYSSAGTVVDVGEGVTDIASVIGSPAPARASRFTRSLPAFRACWLPEFPIATPRPSKKPPSPQWARLHFHGIRTAEVKLGDAVAVIGLGLLGQLTVQVLKAAGCRVLGMDIAPDRAELAAASWC